jgi:hypothetical protein
MLAPRRRPEADGPGSPTVTDPAGRFTLGGRILSKKDH